MDHGQEFCLKWNNHQSTLVSVLENLLANETLVDVTLASDGKYIRAHRLVLTACSTYFHDILAHHPDKHVVIYMKDVTFEQLRSLVQYMYRGEVNICQESLNSFIQTAESLGIKGLADGGSKKMMDFAENLPPPIIHDTTFSKSVSVSESDSPSLAPRTKKPRLSKYDRDPHYITENHKAEFEALAVPKRLPPKMKAKKKSAKVSRPSKMDSGSSGVLTFSLDENLEDDKDVGEGQSGSHFMDVENQSDGMDDDDKDEMDANGNEDDDWEDLENTHAGEAHASTSGERKGKKGKGRGKARLGIGKDGRGRLICQRCGKTFKHISSFHNHNIATMCSGMEPRFHCDICQYSTHRNSDLQTHFNSKRHQNAVAMVHAAVMGDENAKSESVKSE